MSAYHVKITPKELIKPVFSMSPLSERFGFCHTQLSASQKGVSTVYIIIRGQFVGVNKPSRLPIDITAPRV